MEVWHLTFRKHGSLLFERNKMRLSFAVPWEKGLKVWDRPGKICGLTTGSVRGCALEGCRGPRVYVRWPDGHMTMPCSRGLKDRDDGAFQIE